MTLGQRVAVIEDGVVQQVAQPQELYRNPANVFVATFIGSPSMNVAEAEVLGDEIRFGSFRLPLDSEQQARVGGRSSVIVGLRPEAFSTSGARPVEVRAAAVENLGTETHVFFGVDATPVGVATHRIAEEEQPLGATAGTVFVARLGADVDVAAGQSVTLAADASRMYLFDTVTGKSLT
jgi:multiple sugar transport system ATP-binding protein